MKKSGTRFVAALSPARRGGPSADVVQNTRAAVGDRRYSAIISHLQKRGKKKTGARR
jgi:hypothetical protein